MVFLVEEAWAKARGHEESGIIFRERQDIK